MSDFRLGHVVGNLNVTAEVVFAAHLAGRGARVRVGILDTGTGFGDPGFVAEDPLQLSNLV